MPSNGIFVSALVIVLSGTLSVDVDALEGEKQKIQRLLNRIIPPGCENRKLLIPLLKGVRQQENSKNIEALKKLSETLSISEKLLIVSIGYKLITAEKKLNIRKTNYLQTISTHFYIAPSQLDVLEAKFGIARKVDRKALNFVSNLLEPAFEI